MKRLKNSLKYIVIFLLIGLTGYKIVTYFGLVPKKYYTAEHFDIETVKSKVDYNNNGIDDYSDFVIGARIDAQNNPRYDSSYFENGYPPDDAGVCADVIWRAFKHAGYSLKGMIDADIKANTSLYPRVENKPDPNIDFRRVKNLTVFFERFALSITTNTDLIEEWQPGDIVVFTTKHIGIISDRRNKNGVPYLIHNGGQPNREEDVLKTYPLEISAHYRFDASKISEEILK